IGRNATFMRLQFDWSVPTSGDFVQDGPVGMASFEWPVPLDVRDLAADLPPEIVSVASGTDADGAHVSFEFAEGVVPRFYETSPTGYVLDIDIAGTGLPTLAPEELTAEAEAQQAEAAAETTAAEPRVAALRPAAAVTVRPFVNVLGSTVRMVF